MANMKRIHKVTIKRMVDDSPDTSWLGEYANSPTSERLNQGDWCFIGIAAEAEYCISDNPHKRTNTSWTVQSLHSGGLWGIESDSDASYLAEVEQEQLAELREQLKAIGFSSRAISAAFKNVEREGD